MLPYCVLEEIVYENNVDKEEKLVQYKICSKCEAEINPDNYIKNKTICRKCHNENMRKRRNMNTQI